MYDKNGLLQRPLKTINYTDVITFGGYRDDFMLVLNGKTPSDWGESRADRLLFSLHKAKVGSCAVWVGE